jgi:hypothetical protein
MPASTGGEELSLSKCSVLLSGIRFYTIIRTGEISKGLRLRGEGNRFRMRFTIQQRGQAGRQAGQIQTVKK